MWDILHGLTAHITDFCYWILLSNSTKSNYDSCDPRLRIWVKALAEKNPGLSCKLCVLTALCCKDWWSCLHVYWLKVLRCWIICAADTIADTGLIPIWNRDFINSIVTYFNTNIRLMYFVTDVRCGTVWNGRSFSSKFKASHNCPYFCQKASIVFSCQDHMLLKSRVSAASYFCRLSETSSFAWIIFTYKSVFQ